MSLAPRTRLVNPRLGIYFGIFASCYVALVLISLIFEQLSAPDLLLRALILTGPLVLFAVIGLASYTAEPQEYFAAGRRVPSVYCGLGLAATAFGGTGIVCLTGALFIIGFDALAFVSAGLTGFVLMAVLLAPFFRKFGTFTVPTFLGRRFDSRVLRVTSAAFLAVPTLLFLIAEISIGASAAGWLVTRSPAEMSLLMVCAIVVSVTLGGMRSLTWTNVAAAIAALLALVVPVIIVAVLQGHLPIPQLSHGPVVRGVGRSEAIQVIPIIIQPFLSLDLPGAGLQTLVKRFAEPFGSIGPGAYVFISLVLAAGVACAPWLLPRVATAPGVYEARKSLGWAICFFGFVMVTCATIAVFMRAYALDIEGALATAPPDWLSRLLNARLADVTTLNPKLVLSSVAYERDKILIALPVAAGLPNVIAYLAAAGIVAAAFAGACAALICLANLLSEDIINGLGWQPPQNGVRLITDRILIVVLAFAAGLIAILAPNDSLKLLLWSLTLTGASVFPVLVASIWWKRLNVYGAFAGIITGFSIAVLVIVAAEAKVTELSGVLAGLVAIPASTIATVIVSLLTIPPSRQVLELVRDVRVPGGEVIYDREMRLLRLKHRRRT